jgi:hypothetical protein
MTLNLYEVSGVVSRGRPHLEPDDTSRAVKPYFGTDERDAETVALADGFEVIENVRYLGSVESQNHTQYLQLERVERDCEIYFTGK